MIYVTTVKPPATVTILTPLITLLREREQLIPESTINKFKTNTISNNAPLKTNEINFTGNTTIINTLAYEIKKGISFKGKIKQRGEEILSESEKIKQQGEEIANRAQEQYKEVMAIIEEAREKGFSDVVDESGKIIRKFRTNRR